MTRDEKIKLAKECVELWLTDLDDGELNDILFTPTHYPLNLSRWARCCAGVDNEEDFQALKQP